LTRFIELLWLFENFIGDGGTMFGFGGTELLIIIGVIVFLVFGVGRLPQIGEGLGKGIKNFKKGLKSDEIDITPDSEDAQLSDDKKRVNSDSSKE
jgi:sec-independent protein translocase protein TatA